MPGGWASGGWGRVLGPLAAGPRGSRVNACALVYAARCWALGRAGRCPGAAVGSVCVLAWGVGRVASGISVLVPTGWWGRGWVLRPVSWRGTRTALPAPGSKPPPRCSAQGERWLPPARPAGSAGRPEPGAWPVTAARTPGLRGRPFLQADLTALRCAGCPPGRGDLATLRLCLLHTQTVLFTCSCRCFLEGSGLFHGW